MKRLFAATSILLFAAAMAPAEPVAEHPTGSRTTPPTIESLAPRGVSQGATAVLTVEGYNLRGASAVHFSEPTVSGRLLEVKEMPYVAEPPRLGPAGLPSTVDLGPQPPRYQVRLEVTVDEKADVAPVRFRLATEFGTSPAGKILIEPRYHVDSEGEPGHETDSTADDPRKSSLPAILAGVISEPGDEDYFAITVEAGQELVFEEGGMKIGSKIKPIIDLLAADHTPVRLGGKNRSRAGRAFAHRFDKAGTYFVRVSDYEKSGSKDHFYRVKVGDYPLVESAYPLGVRRGETTTAALKGFNLGDGKVTVRGEPSWMDDRRAVVRPETEKGRAFNAVKLALGDHPEVEASGENTEVASAQEVAFPVTINGRLAAGSHYFRFEAKKGQLILVDVTAAQVGSKLDSVIDVLTAGGEPIESATVRAVAVAYTDLFDHTSEQAEIRLQITKDLDAGDYLMLGSEVMLVTRLPRQPDEGIALESFPPIIPGRPTKGAVRVSSLGTSPQAHAKGAPMYKVRIHPPGKQFPPNGLPLVRLYHHNDDGRVPHGKDSFLEFRAPADGEYVVRLRDTHGRGGEDFAYRLALRPPREDFRLSANPRTPNIPQGERVPLRVTAFRQDGFDGDIRISVEDLPAGIHADDTVIPSGQMVATVMLHADAGAAIGEAFRLKIRGTAEIGGKTVSKRANPADTLQFVSVTAPADILITTDKREVVLEPGQDAKITVSVKRKNGFGGRVPVEVLNLPPHTDTPEVGLNRILITEENDSRTFSIRALPGAKPLEQLIYVSGIVETRSSQPTAFTAEPIVLKIVEKSTGGAGGE
jgi:hypothetical protein